MAKSFKDNIKGADKLFSANDITDIQDIQNTQNVQNIENISDIKDTSKNIQKKPRGKGFYRINLKLDGELEEYIKEEAWKNRLSVTEYLNGLIRADRNTKKNMLE